MVPVVRHKRPVPALLCALSPDAREAELPFGQKRMNGIFYLVGLIVVVLLVTYALGLW